MFATVRALFEHILDYAGLFPPAKLPLAEALRHYAEHAVGTRQWLLGRFVCPAARLGELTEQARALGIDASLSVTVLGQGGTTADEFLAQLERDLAAIEQFRQAWWPAVAEVLEVPLPSGDTADVLGRAAGLVRTAQLRTFFEVPVAADWTERVRASCQALAALPGASDAMLGLKVRCGGLTAEAFPSNEALAAFMVRCRDARLPWKATAGLHHPLRFWDEQFQVLMHGFLNVFGAGVLSYAHPLTEAQLCEILRDREGTQFWFQNDRFGWRQWGCTLREVKDLRRRWLPSFGSCSIDEPIADLVALGMIPAKEGAIG
jgi:hypothetical protein